MKKISIIGVCISTFSLCFAQDITLYKNVQDIQTLKVAQPTVVEIKDLDVSGNIVVTDSNGKYIEQQFQVVTTSNVITPKRVQGCTTVCKSAIELADNNLETTFDFPLVTSGVQKGKITIEYAKPLETDTLTFSTTEDSYIPTAFSLVIDGKRILNTMEGGSAHFPRMTAQVVEIEFEYTQPIRFTEVGVGFNKEEKSMGVVRFVYLQGMSYKLYLDSTTRRENISTPSVDLFAKKVEKEISLGESYKNQFYKDRDTDNDGVIDSIDNCPSQSNSDQKDSNSNNIGDMCDDYDYDGISTYYDNCPEIANPDQLDTDKDKKGDMCDKEESRFTEKYPWITWVVFFGVFIAIVTMIYEVIKMKKSNI